MPESSIAEPSRRRGRPILRLTVRLAVLGLAVVTLGLWMVTRSWFIVARITPDLERRLGGPVEIERATYDLAGRLLLEGLTLHSPAHPGDAGEVMTIGRAVIMLDPLALLDPQPRIRGVDLTDLRLCLAEDRRDQGAFTFMALDPDFEAREEGWQLPPYITIVSGIIEVGLHDGDGFDVVGRRAVRGSMSPVVGDERAFVFSLAEVVPPSEPDRPALQINGRWAVTTNATEARLQGLELDDRSWAMCPTWARLWWRQLDLRGRVATASLLWDGGDDLAVELGVENVELTLPIEAGELWARYRDGRVEPARGRPQMHVTSGRIRIDQDGASLDELAGEIRGAGPDMTAVPYQVTLRMPKLPELDWDEREDWGEQVLEQTPFEMTVRLEQFNPRRDESGQIEAVELPLAVVRFFERFRITDWQLSTEIVIERFPGADGRITSRGQVYIHDASGAYEKFPYPLKNVEAYVHFDNDQVTIEYLNGNGADGAPVRIAGRIAPPGPGAAIDLRLTADDVPLDESFRAALPAASAHVFETLLHEPSIRELREAGLLADERSVTAAACEREQLLAEIIDDRERGGDEAVGSAQLRRARQLDRIVGAGPFAPGGRVDLRLNIAREAGTGKKTVITGRVDIDSARLVYRGFPYPVTIVGGSLDWQPDRIVIVPTPDATGLAVVTPGGGEGLISGQIGFRRGPADGVPTRLEVSVMDDRINPLLIAAVPPERGVAAEGGPWAFAGPARSATGRLLDAAGLDGDLRYGGTIRIEPDGSVGYSVDVDLFDGSARPESRLLTELGLPEGRWPPQWRYTDLTARVELSERQIAVKALTGRQDAADGDGADIVAHGSIDLAAPDHARRFVVRSRGTELTESLIDLLPRSLREGAAGVWQRYHPSGLVTAELRYQTDAADRPRLQLEIVPTAVTLAIDDEPVQVRGLDGRLVLEPESLLIDGLLLELGAATRPFGRMTLDGRGAWRDADSAALELDGAWTDATIDCPVTVALLQRIGTTNVGGVELESGLFDARFSYRRGDGPPVYDVTLRPRVVQVRRGEQRLEGIFDERSSIQITPPRITLSRLAGRAGDSDFRLDGTIDHVGHVDADLTLHYEGSVTGPLASMALPPGVVDVLKDLELQDPGASRIDGALRITSIHQDPTEAAERRWRSSFSGEVETEGISLVAGLDFEDVGGLFVIDARREPGRPVQLSVVADAAWGRVLGHPLDAVGTEVRLSGDGTAVLVEGLHGTLHGGAFSGEARFDLGDERGYELNLHLVEVPLQPIVASRRSDEQEPAAPVEDAEVRGQVFAGLTLSGDRGDPTSRRGRGVLRIVDGQVASIPLLLQLVQITQLTLPVSGIIDYADVDFFVAGDELTFERILFESTVGENAPLQLIGEGHMDLESFELDTLFRSRSGWLVLRDLVGGIGDQLWVIRVTGPFDDPEASLLPLPALTAPSRPPPRSLREGVPMSLSGGGP
ncbi:MAG: hypothetical protein ACYTJ0_00930 [Planctomycetota bacterium]